MKLAWMYFAGAGVKLHVGATHRDTLFTILSVSERVRGRFRDVDEKRMHNYSAHSSDGE